MDSSNQKSLKSKIFFVLFLAFVIAVVLRVFIMEGFIVSGDSMSPAIESGDYVFVNKLAYWHKEPKRGDVVVALPREHPRKLLKRIIGLPGERFEITEGKIIIRENRIDLGKQLEETYLEKSGVTTNGEILTQLDPEEYFALGDNREVSIDSRELGLIDKWDIKGKVFGVINFKTLKYKSF